MSMKRILVVLAFIFLAAVTVGVVFYQYLAYRLNVNSVAIVEAPSDSFEVDMDEMPEDVEILSEEEYLELIREEEGLDEDPDDLYNPDLYTLDDTTVPELNDEEIPAGTENQPETEFLSDDEIFEKVEISDRIYNILLIGDDARINEDRGRSDTLILLSYNRDTREVSLVSFMRDMLVPQTMDGKEWRRINNFYYSGGPGKVINFTNYLFSLDVQRYAVIRFASVFALVDQLGGLDIELKATEARVINRIFPEYDAVHEGLSHMNGRQVLAYARMRQIDSDINRTARQRQVLRVTLSKGLETKNLSDLITMARFMFGNVETNIPLNEIITMGFEVFSGEKPTVNELRIPIDNSFSYGRYYGASILVIDFQKNVKALHEYLYGSSDGVKIPQFKRPLLDPERTEEIQEPEPSEETGEEGASADGTGEGSIGETGAAGEGGVGEGGVGESGVGEVAVTEGGTVGEENTTESAVGESGTVGEDGATGEGDSTEGAAGEGGAVGEGSANVSGATESDTSDRSADEETSINQSSIW